MARVVESALLEVDWGVIEAAQAMGASTGQIITKVLIPEAVPGLVLGVTMVAVSLISYSAMAGAVGGGGLGDLAIRYGYQRFRGRHHVLYCSGVGGYGAKHTIFRRMVGEPVKPPLIKAKLKWRWI